MNGFVFLQTNKVVDQVIEAVKVSRNVYNKKYLTNNISILKP